MHPGLLLIILFIGIPLVELYVIIEVGSELGGILTVFLVVFTAVLGGLLVRMQGFSTLMRVKEVTDRGEVPALEMMEGMLLMVAGVMLLLPGFITDIFGFLLLIPPLRQRLIMTYLKKARIIRPAGNPNAHDASTRNQPKIIEGEYEREDDR